MVMNGALLLLSRSFCAAMLMLVETKYFVWYSAFDMGFYFLLKTVRQDFTYWIPVDGTLGFVISVIMRAKIKTITDYTGIVQFRAATELGGIYWLSNTIMAIVFSFAAVAFYFAKTESGAVVLAVETAWLIVISLGGTWSVFFLLFLMLMKKKYRKTFISLDTGNKLAQKYFLEGKTDLEKAAMFTINRSKWKAIEGEAKVWVQDNWGTWEDEQPEFFTEAWKSRIPDDWLSTTELMRQKMAGGGERRRSSFAGLMEGSVRRASATVVPFIEGGGDGVECGVGDKKEDEED
jgi:hypothetical protein